MRSDPVQFSLFDDASDTRDDEKDTREVQDQLSFEFMSRGTGDYQENRDLQPMRV
jgi:hypothetical protein